MTMRALARTAGAAGVLLATSISATPASAQRVNRPLADQLTQQYNQQELHQLQAGDARVYPPSGAVPINGQPPPPPAASLPPLAGPPPAWSYLPR